ncbi:MAG TPA: outer membrane beta-barrel protein [Bdellovibrionota bacterium]|jgi:opacity protein-like surface antigen|nr:outer membrane beta-barrel protein [Bdellovibrionota bacterium]
MMQRLVIVLTLGVGILLPAFAEAGYYEISANGSFYRYDNGIIAGDASQTTSRRLGGGISYSFLESTALEVSYSDTRNSDEFSQISADETRKWRLNRVTQIQNVSIDLVIGFSGRRERFRPYIRGGGGYTIRKVTTGGMETDMADDSETDLDADVTESRSVTAQAGAGFKYYLADRVAIEFSYTVFASELDAPKIYMHQAIAGGLRVVF